MVTLVSYWLVPINNHLIIRFINKLYLPFVEFMLINHFGLKSRPTEINQTAHPQIDNLFISEHIYQQASRMQQISSSKNLCRRKIHTETDTIKKNILKIKQNRRVSDLKELTKQNIKMFFRIQSKKSEYNFQQLRKKGSCKQIICSKDHQEAFDSQLKTDEQRHCKSAKNIRIRCSSLKDSVVSKVSTKPITITTLETEGVLHQYQRVPETEKENLQLNLGRNINGLSRRIADKNYEQRLLLNKLGVKVPIQTMKLITGKAPLGVSRCPFDLKQCMFQKITPSSSSRSTNPTFRVLTDIK